MATLDSPIYTVPLYSQAEAARIIEVPTNTFRNWTSGYWYKTTSGQNSGTGLVTLAPERNHLSVPFLGLAEAYVIAALRKAGIPMIRIRSAIEHLKQGMGLELALVSERLKTDGIDVLFEFVGSADEGADGRVGLAVVQDKQLVFREAIQDSLRSLTYKNGFASALWLPQYGASHSVIVDPRLNGGQPTFVEAGVRVEDVARRARAGEALDDLADDYDIDRHTLAMALGRA